MLILRHILALTALYNDILYIVRPPNSTGGYITYGSSVNNSAIWIALDSATLNGIRVFKTTINNVTDTDVFLFKLKFTYANYTRETSWQTSVLQNHTQTISTDHPVHEREDCCTSTIVLSVSLLTLLILCGLLQFFIFWKGNYSISDV